MESADLLLGWDNAGVSITLRHFTFQAVVNHYWYFARRQPKRTGNFQSAAAQATYLTVGIEARN